MGPRPLPLYLGMAGTTFLGSLAASRALKSGLMSLNDAWQTPKAPLPPLMRRLHGDLNDLLAQVPQNPHRQNPQDPTPEPHGDQHGDQPTEGAFDAFSAAIEAEACRRFGDFLEGVWQYRNHPYRRRLHDPAPLWQAGGVCLRDYTLERFRSDPKAVPLVAIPSLINRSYILDLNGRRSLMRHLARRGVHPMLLDWGDPGPEEQAFDLTAYVTQRIIPALEAAAERAQGPVVVLGYCMGGLLALAACLLRPDLVAGLISLATPWDFSAHEAATMSAFQETIPWFLQAVAELGYLPIDALQVMFSGLEPHSIARKFQSFAHLSPTSPKASIFVGLEDWVNDGVPLAGPVAQECLAGWYGANTPGRGSWVVDGRVIRPQDLCLPSLFLIPERDKIVPPESARALAGKVSGATILHVSLGHIGMITGTGAGRQVYNPITRWLKRNFASQ